MLLIILLRIFRCDQRRREFHFRVASPHADRFFHPRITVQTRRRVHPITAICITARHSQSHLQLPVSFDQISIVEMRKRNMFTVSRARRQSSQQLPGHRRIILTIKRSPPNRLHPHQHRRIRTQQSQSIRNQMTDVVALSPRKVPGGARPRQRLRRTNIDEVANQRWPGKNRRDKHHHRHKKLHRMLHRTGNVTFHVVVSSQGGNHCLHSKRREREDTC
jgi:hypothetical protein